MLLACGCGRFAFDSLGGGGGDGSADANDDATGDPPDVAPPSCPTTAIVSDNFDDGTLMFGAGQVWAGTFESPVIVGESQGQLVVTFPTGAASQAHAGVYTTRYDLSTACAVVLATMPPDQTTSAYSYIVLEESQGANRSKATLAVLGGMLIVRKEVMQNPMVVAMTPYVPSTHRWWRIRTGGNTVAWETSPDRVAWTTLHSEPVYLDLAQSNVTIGAGTDLSSTAAGTATFDRARLYTP
jgi:hypothetical protein